MVGQKVDFKVQQGDSSPEASHSLKAGSSVTLSSSSDGATQVLHQGVLLGTVPADVQHHFTGQDVACTVRSVRRQDGNLSQTLVRAVFSSPEAAATELPGK